MQNRYRFTPDTDIRQIKALPAILQLQMNRNAMMASFRWYESLRDRHAEPECHDMLIAILALAGWAAEGLRTIEKNRSVFRRELLSQDESRQTWDDCFEQELPQVRLLRKVRNKYFAHWDPDIARKVVERVARGEIEPVFVEWNKRQNTDSFCTMAHLAVATDLFGIASRDDELKRAREIGRVVLRVARMIEDLVAGVLKEAGVKLQRVETGSKDDSAGG